MTVVLYGYENWSLALREEYKLIMFWKKVPRRIFEPTKDEITWEWREPYKEELNDLYSSSIIIQAINLRRIRWMGH